MASNFRKLFSLMLIALIMISVFPKIEASAADAVDPMWGIDGNGVLTIYNYNPGEMPDYSTSEAPWYSSREYIKKVVIQSGITSIGGYAFSHCENLTEVTIPSTVKSIGKWAFAYCGSLKSVKGTGVTNIGYDAFYNCKSLESATFPIVTNIDSGAFSQCEKLSYIKIPNTVTTIGSSAFSGCNFKTAGPIGGGYDYEFGWTDKIPDNAFAYCKSLESINLPSTITSIGNYAFKYCEALKKININKNLTSIGYEAFNNCAFETAGPIGGGYDYEFGWTDNIPTRAFYGCSSLISVVLPDSITGIGSSAFEKCISITSIDIPENVTEIGSNAFYSCQSLINIELPEGLTVLSHYMFQDCDALKNIDIPENVTEIGRGVFQGCDSLISAKLPEGITVIESMLFNYCPSFKEVWIPESVTSINYGAFRLCDSFTDVHYGGSKSQWDDITIENENTALTAATFTFGKYDITVIQPDIGTISVDKTSATSDEYVTVTPQLGYDIEELFVNGVAINGNTFKPTEDSVVSAILKEGIIATGEDGAATWTIYPDGRMVLEGNGSLSWNTFQSWDAYSSYFDTVIIGEGIVDIPEDHFWDYTNIKEITIPETVQQIGCNALMNCVNLEKINYNGSRSQWNKILKQSGWNFQTGDYTMSFGKYDITVEQAANGTVSIDKTIVATGEVVTVTAVPAEGYNLEKILVNDVAITGNTFTVYADSIVTAEFESIIDNIEINVNNTASKAGATITSPEGGWKEGENTFTVSAEIPCVVLVSHDGGHTYARISATATGENNTYSFTADITTNVQLAVAVAGDFNKDGEISVADITRLKAAYRNKVDTDALQTVIGDINGDGEISVADITRLKAAYRGKIALAW